ncbi:RagB/SusD family nutrient uptake outer membrane protein [Prevotella sp.]|uniref:RagB/SusD family nutrient uptake outer membrane protein n=1 Tax=Prevotella sp. TaxID=59823 RepID=UPI002F956F51
MKTSKIISLLAGAALLTACSLKEEPYGFYSENNFYKTEADAEAALMYAYGDLTYLEYSRSVFFLGDMPTEELTTKSDATAENQDINNWKVDNFKTNTTLENYFKYAFIGINRANGVIQNVENATFNEQKRNQILGEAYFLRAWNYFNLVRNFGLVPMHTTMVDELNETSAPLAGSLDEVYDLILGDCRKASDLLQVYPKPQLGRTDRVAAQSLAAKAYLYVASAKESGVKLYRDMKREVELMYDSAAYFAGEVVEKQTTYGFSDNLLDIYDVDKPAGPEHIFLMSMDRSGVSEGQYSKISKMFIPYVDGATIYLKQGSSATFIPSHDGWGEYQTTSVFFNSYDPADKRKTELIVDKVYRADGTVNVAYPGKLLYPFCRKYIDPKFDGDKTSTRPFLLRYSDVALIYAEAVGPTAKAYELVNFIRRRAGLGNLAPNLSKADFRKAVLNERKFEMAFEGDYMYDLRRTNRIQSIPEAQSLGEDQTTFYPIPQAEINLNGSLR